MFTKKNIPMENIHSVDGATTEPFPRARSLCSWQPDSLTHRLLSTP